MAQRVDWNDFGSDEEEQNVPKVYIRKDEGTKKEPEEKKQPDSGSKQPESGDKPSTTKSYPPRKTKAELIDLVKNHDRRRIYLQLLNVSYKAREDDVKEFYQNLKYSSIYSKKEGLFQFEFENKEDAIAFLEFGTGKILGREFYVDFSHKNYKPLNTEGKKNKYPPRDEQDSPNKDKTYQKKTVVYQVKDGAGDDEGKSVTKGRGEKNFTADGKNKLEQDKITDKKHKNCGEYNKKEEQWTHEKADNTYKQRESHVEYVKKDKDNGDKKSKEYKDYDKKKDKDYKEYKEKKDKDYEKKDYDKPRKDKDYDYEKRKDYDKPRKDKDYDKPKKDKDYDKPKKKYNAHITDDTPKDPQATGKKFKNDFSQFDDDEDGSNKPKAFPLVINTTSISQGNQTVEYKVKQSDESAT